MAGIIIRKWLLPTLILGSLLPGLFLASYAAENENPETQEARIIPEYLDVETCLACHEDDPTEDPIELPRNKHWLKSDPRSPGSKESGCESCHGPGSEHLNKEGEINVPGLVTFGENPNVPAAQQNQMCLNCHQNDVNHWQGSLHDNDDIACASCHAVHSTDPTLDKLKEQAYCYNCHQNVRAESYRPFGHPIKDELIRCTDCHNPHGSPGPALLHQFSLNDNCYSCHAEKRGPYLWEHEPVTEDCSLCHLPHGSVHPALLIRRPPMLCQQCHQSASITHARQGFYFGKAIPDGGHEYDHSHDNSHSNSNDNSHDNSNENESGDGGHDDHENDNDQDNDQSHDSDQDHDQTQEGPGGSEARVEGGTSRFLLGGSCLNCHSRTHGSNHPSGFQLMR